MDSNEKPSISSFNDVGRQSPNDEMESQMQANNGVSANHSSNNCEKSSNLISNQNEEAANISQVTASTSSNVNLNHLASYSVSCSGAMTDLSSAQSTNNQNTVCRKQGSSSVARLTTNSMRANRRFVSMDLLNRIPTSKTNRDMIGAAVAGCSGGE